QMDAPSRRRLVPLRSRASPDPQSPTMRNNPGSPAAAEVLSMVGKSLSTRFAGGADLQVVKERLGHASIVTTERYLHSLPTADETALDALSKIRLARPA